MRKKPSGIVTLITDFGLMGEYAGAMKGAILNVNPRCQVVDITHQVAAQDVLQASFILKNTYPYYPVGTVHIVMVDPGVGTQRKPVVLKKEGHFFVGPDNGVFTFVLSGEKNDGYEITRQKLFLSPLSPTFHGRDIFAPVAGHLSLGMDARRLGPRLKEFIRVEWPRPEIKGKQLVGRILFADAFGNLITNISRGEYGPQIGDRPWQIKGKSWRIDRLQETYPDVHPGQPLALFGSAGLLEIAVNRGNAQLNLGLKPGDLISINRL
ncbi:MAG: SAM-dependent chlorinase/fluorinase [Pseudomonadota bacterium]